MPLKRQSALILIFICLPIMSPLHVSVSNPNDSAVIASLDVCSFSGAALSVNSDAPAVHESQCLSCAPCACEYNEIPDNSLKASHLVFPEEHPPKV